MLDVRQVRDFYARELDRKEKELAQEAAAMTERLTRLSESATDRTRSLPTHGFMQAYASQLDALVTEVATLRRMVETLDGLVNAA